MLIQNIEALCKLIKSWNGINQKMMGKEIRSPVFIPDAIKSLNCQLGRIWADNEHPLIITRHNQIFGLFNNQNTFTDPNMYKADDFGVVSFWSENQGVFGLGYVPGHPNIYATSEYWYDPDWKEIEKPPAPPDQTDTPWGMTNCPFEHGLIELLLTDFLVMYGQFLPAKKTEQDIPVFRGQLFEGCDFWTNSNATYVANEQWRYTFR